MGRQGRLRTSSLVRALAFGLLATALLTVPAFGVPRDHVLGDDQFSTRLSQPVALRYWLAHPDQAPESFRERFQHLQPALASARAARQPTLPGATAPARPPAVQVANRFNRDVSGLPQNEESITGCHANPNIILGGTNDYRGLIDPEGNFTGWHFSTDGGNSVANEGLLPPVPVAGAIRPSGGDPVVAADDQCNLFAASLNYDPFNPFAQSNGIGVYKTTSTTLTSCPGGSSPACWPTRRAAAVSEPGHFLDKPWMDVGPSGSEGTVVWVAYTDFFFPPDPLTPFTASIKAVRCDVNLSACTAPILISDQDRDVQFADVTIGPDGRTYITWAEIRGELEGTPQTFIVKLRIAPAGSTTFGPTQIIATETLAIPFGGHLHANDFRIATYPKNEVVLLGGRPRIFVVWDACAARPFGFVCEEAQIKLAFSDNDGASWSPQAVISEGADNYFPTITTTGGLAITSDADDAGPAESGTGRRARRGRLAIAWYTNRFDPTFHSRQDVELVTVNPSTVQVTKRQRVSPISNETQADPLLGGLFIGDYFEVFAHDRTAYVHFNANYQQLPLLGQGVPVPQQDNYIVKAGL
jgi:hypothetical protein